MTGTIISGMAIPPEPVDQLAAKVEAQLEPMLPQQSAILVGLSGGVDSVVLLHLLHRLAARHSWRLSALHVHHGISPNADAWAGFCATLCARLGVDLQIEHVDIAPLRTHGVEAAARELRHAALARQRCDYIALAHHADDQAETLLLQLLRGTGVRGASAMPVLSSSRRPVLSQSRLPAERTGVPQLLRPLLHSSRREILDYAAMYQLSWIEDESNADNSYPRNFLRHRVLPLLSEKFPAWRDTLGRSAQHFAEASDLLDELAQQDAVQAVVADTLAVASLQVFSPARAKNLLRYFLHRNNAPMPQAVQLDDMLRQLCDARGDAAVCIEYGADAPVHAGRWQVRRYRGKAYVQRAPAEFERDLILHWHGENELAWAPLDSLIRFQRVMGQGISLVKLQQAAVSLRLRRGGESLRPRPQAATRTLKKLLQEHEVPPWRRERLPLLYCGEQLVCVVGVAIAAKYQATKGELGLLLTCAQFDYDVCDCKNSDNAD